MITALARRWADTHITRLLDAALTRAQRAEADAAAQRAQTATTLRIVAPLQRELGFWKAATDSRGDRILAMAHVLAENKTTITQLERDKAALAVELADVRELLVAKDELTERLGAQLAASGARADLTPARARTQAAQEAALALADPARAGGIL